MGFLVFSYFVVWALRLEILQNTQGILPAVETMQSLSLRFSQNNGRTIDYHNSTLEIFLVQAAWIPPWAVSYILIPWTAVLVSLHYGFIFSVFVLHKI